MKDSLPFVLILLIVATSMNRCEKIRPNDKRTFGLVKSARVGRSMGMTGLTRIDRAAGLVQYPRVGRTSSTGYYSKPVSDYDSEISNESNVNSDFDLDVLLDVSYPDKSRGVKRQGLIPLPRVGRSLNSVSTKRDQILSTYETWFGSRLHQRLQRERHREHQRNRTVKLPWTTLFFLIRDYSNPGRWLANNFTPRLGRESDQHSSSLPQLF